MANCSIIHSILIVCMVYGCSLYCVCLFTAFACQLQLLRSCLPQGIYVKGFEDRMVKISENFASSDVAADIIVVLCN